MRWLLVFLLILFVLVGLGQIGYYLAILPDEVAVRFGAEGEVESSMHKLHLVGMHLAILLVGAGYFLAGALLIHKLPAKYFAVLPNKDYWLAPERRAQTLSILTGKLLRLGVATIALFDATFQLIYMVNAGSSPALMDNISPFMTTIYLTLVFIGVIRFKRTFNRIPRSPDDDARAA